MLCIIETRVSFRTHIPYPIQTVLYYIFSSCIFTLPFVMCVCAHSSCECAKVYFTLFLPANYKFKTKNENESGNGSRNRRSSSSSIDGGRSKSKNNEKSSERSHRNHFNLAKIFMHRTQRHRKIEIIFEESRSDGRDGDKLCPLTQLHTIQN